MMEGYLYGTAEAERVLRELESEAEITAAAAAVVNDGMYRTIVADPPWPYPDGFARGNGNPHRQDRERGVKTDSFQRAPLPYQSMTVAEIQALPVRPLIAADARLFLWATNKYLPAALRVMEAWGFAYKQLLVWDKTPNFTPLSGSVAPTSAEFLLVGTVGSCPVLAKWDTAVVRGRKPRTQHSVKPDVFLDLAERVSPGPYLELFARRQRLGWDTWGDESLGHVEMAS